MLTGRPLRRAGVVAVIVAVLGLAVPVAAAVPARADIVRQKQQWVLDALRVPAAWQVSRGRGVLVAVIDSGVDPTVSDLTGSVITGPNLSHVPTTISNPNWGVHGTWMASLIAGHGHGPGGQDGILGVAPESRILSIRVITDRSDPYFQRYEMQSASRGQGELAAAIRYAVSHHAGVISMSLGYEAPSLVVRSALQDAMNHNVVVVASSGNSGTAQTASGKIRAPYSFPADYPGVIGVAATNQAGAAAYFSSDNLSVEVAAPGVNVPAEGRGNKYWLVSGTSPACALTAGVAALVRSRYPGLTAVQVRRAIVSSAVDRPRGGYSDQIGFGIVNAAGALAAAGRIAHQAGSGQAPGQVTAGRYFGDGPAGVPPVPVPPRSGSVLIALLAAAAAALVLLVISLWRFTAGLAAGRPALPGQDQPGAPPGWGTGQQARFEGTAVDVRYPYPPGYGAGWGDGAGFPPPGQGYPPPGQGFPSPGQGFPPPGQGYRPPVPGHPPADREFPPGNDLPGDGPAVS